ncbi:MAG: UDP-N-acetylmuramoyl-L-alanine--D-glutamate ligase [Parachlamydiaceae bacterium]|nr:UDP-N-acetylmuramoyl-L-alanine--D-glutamate ligase [Parachlamydiaceae bacterium]
MLEGKSVLVLGLGISGRAAADFLLAQGSKVHAIDDNILNLQKTPEIQSMISNGLIIVDRSIDLSKMCVDCVVVSPGISRKHPIYVQALEQRIQILGEVELAFRFLAQKKCKCIGITGTNGKTTVTLLLEHIFNVNGIQAKAVGNSGFPLTALLSKFGVKLSETVLFIELSSFQLETAESKILDAAVILNIKEDHLDRYSSFEEYAKAKIHLFDCVKLGGSCYIEEECYSNFAKLLNNRTLFPYGYTPANFIYTDLQDIKINGKANLEIPLEYRGHRSHDLENMMAAYGIAVELGITPDKFIEAFASFKKPEHRLQFVGKINEITFIDDSKATNVDAVIRAVESITDPIILIAGGVDKGGSYAPWKQAFTGKVLKICTIGQAAEKIKNDLEGQVQIEHFQTLESAVIHAATIAKKNETVLLSPGCSSYDMFSSYAHRGTCFQEIVQELAVYNK